MYDEFIAWDSPRIAPFGVYTERKGILLLNCYLFRKNTLDIPKYAPPQTAGENMLFSYVIIQGQQQPSINMEENSNSMTSQSGSNPQEDFMNSHIDNINLMELGPNIPQDVIRLLSNRRRNSQT